MLGFLLPTELIDRVNDACSLLPPHEQADGRRAVALCRGLGDSPRVSPTADATRRELQRLAEVLGRRSAKGIPAATLARAALALLADDHGAVERACRDCDTQLVLQGL